MKSSVLLRGFLVILVALLGSSAFLASPASAHAILESSTPSASALSPSAVTDVTLRFSEPVKLIEGSVRVLDPEGVDVVDSVAQVDGEVTAQVGQVEAGTYLVVWKILSADSHPVSGSFTFSSESTSESAVASGTGGASPTRSVANEVAYAGMTLLFGAALLVLLTSLALTRKVKLVAVTGAALLAGSAVLAAGTQVAALGTENASFALLSLFGLAQAARLVLAVALLVLVARRGPRPAIAALVLGLAVTTALDGHASTSLLLASAATLHALSAASWLGGLFVAFLVVDFARPFSRVAPFLVGALVLTGVLQGLVLVPSLADLASTYGVILVVKVALVAVMVVLSGFSARRVRRSQHPRRLLAAESAVGLAVVLLTGNLTATPPPLDDTGIHAVVEQDALVVQADLSRPDDGTGVALLSLDVSCDPGAGCVKGDEDSLHADQGDYADYRTGGFAVPPGVSARFVAQGQQPVTLALEGSLPAVTASVDLPASAGVLEVVVRLDDTRSSTVRFEIPPA